MRIALAIPLLLLGACQVSKDENNGTTSVTYNSDVAENAAADIGNQGGRQWRRLAALERLAEQPADRLVVDVVPGLLGARAGLAVAADRAIDQSGIECRELLVAEVVASQVAGFVIFDEHVRACGEPARDFLTGGFGNIQRHGFFAAIGTQETVLPTTSLRPDSRIPQ